MRRIFNNFSNNFKVISISVILIFEISFRSSLKTILNIQLAYFYLNLHIFRENCRQVISRENLMNINEAKHK